MHTGMLWFDNSTKTAEQKIKKAADYYEKKYGKKPDLCLLNPATLGSEKIEVKVDGITIRTYRPVLPGHIWIGLEDKA